LLQKAEIFSGDFAQCIEHADNESFVYFDPPYRPISMTASFTSYSKDIFDDQEQKRLRKVYGELDKKDACVMLSNSDPKNVNPNDNFFDDLYRGYQIERLNATRLINCNAERRGVITEILVMNY
jgi:DNA adenine methylase